MTRAPLQRRSTASKNLGDDYRDVLGLDYIVRMLRDPTAVLWVSFEDREAGSLDDVIVGLPDRVRYIQAKYTVEDSVWTLQDLFVKSSERSKSLLQKWADGWRRVRSLGPAYEAVIQTRRQPDPVLAALLDDGRFKPEIWTDPEFAREHHELLAHLALVDLDAAQAQHFLSEVRFEFGGQEVEARLEEVRRDFAALGGTDDGWDHLLTTLRTWVRYEQPGPDGRVRVGDVRLAAKLWDPQRAALPQDVQTDARLFVLDTAMRTELESALDSSSLVLIEGPPGSGKSSLLTWLAQAPPAATRSVIRHHCFVGMDDDTAAARLNPEDAAFGLLAAIVSQARGELSSPENPKPSDLAAWLREVAAVAHQNGQSVLLILDGLDHMVREHQLDAVRSLLHWLPAPIPPGLKVVLGTQPVQRLLPGVLDRQARHLTMTGFDEVATGAYLHAYSGEVPDDALVAAALERSQGNPLYLHYLMASTEGQRLTPERLERTAPYGGNIESYYAALWRRPDSGAAADHGAAAAAQGLLAVLGWANFGLPVADQGILAQALTLDLVRWQAATQQVRHLLDQDAYERGELRLYHESLRRFVREQAEAAFWKAPALNALLTWLREHADEETRWSALWELELYSGRTAPLLEGVSRDWVRAALAAHRPHRRITDLVLLALRTAASVGEIRTLLRLGWLRAYVANVMDDPDLPALTNLLRTELRLGRISTVERALAANRYSRAGQVELMQAAGQVGSWALAGELAAALLKAPVDQATYAAAAFSDLPPSRLYAHYQKVQNSGQALRFQYEDSPRAWGRAFQTYLNNLVLADRKADLDELLDLTTGQDADWVSDAHLRWHLRQHTHQMSDTLQGSRPTPYRQVIELVTGNSAPVLDGQPLVSSLSGAKPNYFDDGGWREAHAELLWRALIWAAQGRGDELQQEQARLRTQTVHGRFLAQLIDFARSLEAALDGRQRLDVTALGDALAEVGVPYNPNDADYYAWQAGQDGWLELLDQAIELLAWSGQSVSLQSGDLQVLSRVLGIRRLLPWLEFSGVRLLQAPSDTLAWLEASLLNSLEPFFTRADLLSRAAAVAAAAGDAATAARLSDQATQDLLGHGFHKDVVLYQVMDTLRAADYPGGDSALLSLTPLLDVIMDVTDGDEMRGMPAELAHHLLDSRSPALLGLYAMYVAKEDVGRSDHMAGRFLESCAPDDPAAWALAMSLVGDGLAEAKTYLRRAADHARAVERQEAPILDAAFQRWLDVELVPKPPESAAIIPQVEPKVDAPLLSPEEMSQWLGEEHEWNAPDHFTATLKVWASGHSMPPRAVAQQIADDLLARDPTWRRAAPLDALYHVLRRQGEHERAFRALVAAQAADNGWSSYFTDEAECEARVGQVLTHSPARLEEFITASAAERIASYGAVLMGPRLVKALMRGGRHSLGQAIAQDFTAFGRELMGSLPTTLPAWTQGAVPYDALDLLLLRLAHVWPEARVRAAKALAELAQRDDRVVDRLVAWLEQEPLESRQLGALVALALVAETQSALVIPVLTRVGAALFEAGLATRLLVRDLCQVCGHVELILPPVPPNWVVAKSEPFPAWFGRLLGIWPGLERHLERLEKFAPDVCARLYGEVLPLGLTEYLADEANTGMLRAQDRGLHRQTFVQPLARDLLDTALQRVLTGLVLQDQMQLSSAISFALENFAVDLSLIGLQPEGRPAWLPKPDQQENLVTWPAESSTAVAAHLRLTTAVQELPLAISAQQVQADGRLAWRYAAVAFAYRTIGELPPAQAVWDALSNDWVVSDRLTTRLLDFAGDVRSKASEMQIGGLLVQPLVGPLLILGGRWTPLAGFCRTFVMLPQQDALGVVLPGLGSLVYAAEGMPEEAVVEGHWWQSGILTGMFVNEAGASTNCGFILQAKSAFVAAQLEQSSWSLGWVSQCQTATRPGYGDQEEVVEMTELHGVSSILRPYTSPRRR